ncbi:MAG: shikimate dehydrogenase [Armatimonadota bacterium]
MNRFGFFIHPLDIKDVIRFEPKAADKRPALVEKIIEWMPPYKASHITGLRSVTGQKAEGWFIAIPYMPSQFISLHRREVYKKIIAGGKMAEGFGAQILGLGGFTSVAGDAGITVSKNLDIAVTSGNSYTIATAIEATVKAAEMMGKELKKCKAAIVGATGSIGSVCAAIMAPKVSRITLISRNLQKLKKTAESVEKKTKVKPKITTDIDIGLRDADIIIAASASSGGIIKSYHLKPGTLICDVALPHDVCRTVANERPDVLVIEGGLVEVPGDVDFGYDFGYPPKIALACMAETMILTLDGRFENYSLGRSLKVEKVELIAHLAKKHGFKLAGFRSFDKIVENDKIREVVQESKKAAAGRKIFTFLFG